MTPARIIPRLIRKGKEGKGRLGADSLSEFHSPPGNQSNFVIIVLL